MPRMTRSTIYINDVTVKEYPIWITGTADLLLKIRINALPADKKNPYDAAASALYWLDGKPEVHDREEFARAMAAHPRLGCPIYAVERAAIDRIKGGQRRTEFNTAFRLLPSPGEDYDQGTGPLAVLEYDSVEPMESPDGKRFVARISGWSMTAVVRHLEQSKFPIEKIIDAIDKAGKGGIGSYAPCGYLTEPGKFGTFRAGLLE